jgi:hypothetical protein
LYAGEAIFDLNDKDRAAGYGKIRMQNRMFIGENKVMLVHIKSGHGVFLRVLFF